MLYHFLADYEGVGNLFRYITFRTGGALMTALLFCFIFGPAIIRMLKVKQKRGQPIRSDGPASHLLAKQGTPTMGGVMILLSVSVATLLWADLSNGYVWATFIVTLAYGLIGLVDDILKIKRGNSKGLPAKSKIFFQTITGLGAVFWIVSLSRPEFSTALAFPFMKDFFLELGWFYFVFAIVVLIGASNAVNLTDGLDGLAIFPVMIATAVFLVIAYMTGHAEFSSYLHIPSTPGSGELTIFCGALVGAALGFLWYNAPPAAVFMGDVGSLAMGGALGAISLITKHELVLVIVGGLFVLEAASVIIQVASYKLTKKRIFRMAPIHHHFEQKGIPESTIVIRFWIIAVILGLIGLATLKLR